MNLPIDGRSLRSRIRMIQPLFSGRCLVLILSFSFLLLNASEVMGQLGPPPGAPEVVPAAPNATKMTEYVAQRPSMYTGTANISVPLYSVDFDGWKLPFSLSYNASGVRPAEEASEVGLGWALNMTGVISRTINGGDDFYPGKNGSRKGYLFEEWPVSTYLGFSPIAGQPNQVPGDSYYAHLASSRPDTRPDVFNYNFFGYSGSFVLTPLHTGSIKAIKITQDACSISYSEADGAFTVVTPNGFKGIFSVRERSTTFSSSGGGESADNWQYCCSQQFIDYTYYRDWSRMFRATTSWYLEKVISPNGKILNFEYDLESGGPANEVYSKYVSLNRTFGEFRNITSPRMCIQTVQEHVYLKKISSTDFTIDLSMSPRDDLRPNTLFQWSSGQAFPNGQTKLRKYTSIHILGLDPSSTLDKQIAFKTSYFNETYHKSNIDDEGEVRWLRLKLDRVSIDDQEYSFYYDRPDELPDKLTTAIDHFGFFNGVEQDKRMLLPPVVIPFLTTIPLSDTGMVQSYRQQYDRRADIAKGKIGTLKMVRYPTRGYTTFTYDQHSYVPNQALKFREELGSDTRGTAAGGARIRTIRDFDFTGSLARRKDYYYSENPTDSFSPSSGKLMSPLYSRYYYQRWDVPTNAEFIYRTPASIPGSYSAQGHIIGYSKITEVVQGGSDSSFVNVYRFENRPNKYYKYLVSPSGTPNLNGQLIETENFDARGHLTQKVINSDYYNITNNVLGIAYEYTSQFEWGPSTGEMPSQWLFYAVPYYLEGTLVVPRKVETFLAPSGKALTFNADGSVNASSGFVTVTESTFETNGLLRRQGTKSSTGEVIAVHYRRAADFAEVAPVYNYMASPSVNIIEPVVEAVQFRADSVVAAYGNVFGFHNDASGVQHVRLDSSYVWNSKKGKFAWSDTGLSFAPSFETAVSIKNYSADGKIQEYVAKDGIVNSFIWGYGNTLPVVRAQGIRYSDLKTAYDASVGSNFETLIRTHPKTVGKPITTFTHNPLVGPLRIVSPNLTKVSYDYDDKERLKTIRDNDGNILEQHEFHLRERLPTRILDAVTSLDFGVVTQDFFQPTFLPYEKCGNYKKVVRLKNTGEDDLEILNIDFPTGFSCDWTGGTIGAGSSVDLIVYFNRFVNLNSGTYSGSIVFDSNRNGGIGQIAVTGTLVDRLCALQPSVTPLDLGQTTSTFLSKTITLQNSGNGPLKIIGTPYNWDGTSTNLGAFQSNVFTFGTSETCLFPGESRDVLVSANMAGGNGVYSGKYTLVTDVGCPPVDIPITAKRRPPSEAMVINIIPEPSTSVTFTTPSTTINLRVQNTGVYTLHVTGITANVVDPKFQISTSPFNLEPGEERVVSVAFTPDAFDFNQHDILYTFVSDKTSGDPTVALSAKRNAVRSVSLSSSLLVFNVPNAPQSVTITNTGNDKIYFDADGLTYAFAAPGGGPGTPSETSVYWDASISNVASVLDPGQTKSISIRLLPGWNDPTRQFVGLTFNKTPGVPDAYIEVKAETRILGYPSGPVTIPSSTELTFGGTFTIYNLGNTEMTLLGYASTNSVFTVTDTFPLTVAANGSVTAHINFNSGGLFNTQTATLTFNSNATGYQSGVVSVNVQATLAELISLMKTDPSTGWVVKPSTPNVVGILYNNGNVPVRINAISMNGTSFDLEINRGGSGNYYISSKPCSPTYTFQCPRAPSFPSYIVLPPNSSINITLYSNIGFFNGGDIMTIQYSKDAVPYTPLSPISVVVSAQLN